jgi:hydroxypyruvate reductase
MTSGAPDPLGRDHVARRTLRAIFAAGLAAADPRRCLAPRLGAAADDRIVLALGKASIAMARTAEEAWARPIRGLVVARPGEAAPNLSLPVVYGSHPIPDRSSLAAGRRLFEIATRATAGDRVTVLLSGGASAMAAAPGPGLSIEDKAALTNDLLRSGAAIEEINLIRRHLSLIKGGRLAAACHPARVETYAISDVSSDAPEAIGSGPTVADPTTIDEARALLRRYGVAEPTEGWSESVKPGDPRLAGSTFEIIASGATAHQAMLDEARRLGFSPVSLGANICGEARVVASRHASAAQDYAVRGSRVALISGGELTVTVSGTGRGGPNFEYAAALALGLRGLRNVHALSADSDGLDGGCAAAGAFADGAAAEAAEQAGLGLDRALANNDCATAFSAIGRVFAPGPTGTNLNDFRIILVDPQRTQ